MRCKIDQYCDVMEEVKRRTNVVHGFLNGSCFTMYKATNLECMCLQIRKILELIALGSLVVNKIEYAKQHSDFHKHWNGGEILKKLEAVNPSFYPAPIKEVPSIDGKAINNLVDVEDGYLTKEEFVKVYGRCGKMAHADNPFGKTVDYEFYEKQITEWMGKIRNLLNVHKIKLVDDPNMYLIHMKEDRDDKVHGYTFAPQIDN